MIQTMLKKGDFLRISRISMIVYYETQVSWETTKNPPTLLPLFCKEGFGN